MDLTLTKRSLRFGGWSAVIFSLCIGIGLVLIVGWVPPTPPTATAGEIYQLYQADYFRIRTAMIFIMLGAGFIIPFTSAVSVLIARVEGGFGTLSATALVSGFAIALLTFFPAVVWLVAAFRPERNPELLYLLNDASWLMFVGALFITYPFFIVLAIACFAESGEVRVFQRWFGYFNAWIAISFLPGQLLFFVKTGPFAWNGLLAFYLPFGAFFLWLVPTVRYLWKAANETG